MNTEIHEGMFQTTNETRQCLSRGRRWLQQFSESDQQPSDIAVIYSRVNVAQTAGRKQRESQVVILTPLFARPTLCAFAQLSCQCNSEETWQANGFHSELIPPQQLLSGSINMSFLSSAVLPWKASLIGAQIRGIQARRTPSSPPTDQQTLQ